MNRWPLNLWSEGCEERREPVVTLQGNQNKEQPEGEVSGANGEAARQQASQGRRGGRAEGGREREGV